MAADSARTPPSGSSDPVVDPTKNVLDLVAAAIARQDDLREMEGKRQREIADLRQHFDREIREAESARIDAIRAVDVGAVNRAAEVQATQASALAAQVAAAAEAMRTQVAAAARAASIALAAALGPVQKDIADLRRAQYEAQGKTTAVVETRERGASVGMWIAVAIGGLGFMVTVIGSAIGLALALK